MTWLHFRRGAWTSFCPSSAIDKERSSSDVSSRSGETTLAQRTELVPGRVAKCASSPPSSPLSRSVSSSLVAHGSLFPSALPPSADSSSLSCGAPPQSSCRGSSIIQSAARSSGESWGYWWDHSLAPGLPGASRHEQPRFSGVIPEHWRSPASVVPVPGIGAVSDASSFREDHLDALRASLWPLRGSLDRRVERSATAESNSGDAYRRAQS